MNVKLKAQKRDEKGKKLSTLRQKGFVPAIVYGKGIDNVKIKVTKADFVNLRRNSGENNLIDLAIDDEKKPRTVLIQDIASDAIKGDTLHVDFYQVRLDEKIKTEVTLVFEGDSPAVKDLNGTLLRPHQTVEVETLPGNIPSEIVVDIYSIATFDDHLTVADLNPGEGVIITLEPDEIVASVTAPRTEAEMDELDAPVSGDVGDVVGVVDTDEETDSKTDSAGETKSEKVEKKKTEEAPKQ